MQWTIKAISQDNNKILYKVNKTDAIDSTLKHKIYNL